MIGQRIIVPAGGGRGTVWPSSGNDTPQTIGDVFGWRTLSGGYDFHRGVDMPTTQGDPVYAPIGGAVIRANWSHFRWTSANQFAQWTQTTSNGGTYAVTSSALRLTGTTSAPELLRCDLRRSDIGSDFSYDLEIPPSYTFDGSGRTILGLRLVPDPSYHPSNTEFLQLTYDGATLRGDGEDTGGAFTQKTAAVSSVLRLRLRRTGTTIQWRYDTDQSGRSLSPVGSEAAVSFTGEGISTWQWYVTVERQSGATPTNVDVVFTGMVDGYTIGRFGNWATIVDATGSRSVLLFHSQEFSSWPLTRVDPGEQVALVGRTGFRDDLNDADQVQTPHPHLEWREGVTAYNYDQDEPTNPLGSGRLPRTYDSSNITVARATVTDTDFGAGTHRLTITEPRGTQQDFVMNQVSLTGNLATRTFNRDTRAGLDPADNDNNIYDGIKWVPASFTGASASNVIEIFFDPAVVGATFAAAEVRDTEGTLLWSDP